MALDTPTRVKCKPHNGRVTLGGMQSNRVSCRQQYRRRIVALILYSTFIPSATAQDLGQAHFRLQTRAIVEKRLKSFAADNQTREDIIRGWFAQSGCAKRNLSEQPVKFGLPPNVICVLPGETAAVIVVGAHTDKVVRAGDGVVDNWSGASLLPSLLFSLSSLKRHHTFVFIGFTGEEIGMVGSEYYVEDLAPAA